MDDIDRKILKLLQDNARVSLKTIAENTFLSSPAVSARIEKLEKDGGCIPEYHGVRCFYRAAAEVWKNQHTDRVFHACGAAWSCGIKDWDSPSGNE